MYKKAADMLGNAGDSVVFMGEQDPVLIQESLPMLLKLYELVLEKNPDNADLQIATGSMFVMYANAFVQGPAEMLPENQYLRMQQELKRAKLHYLRGRNHIKTGLELKYPGFNLHMDTREYSSPIDSLAVNDCKAMYWYSAATLAAVTADPLDSSVSVEFPIAYAMLIRILELDPEWSDGSVHELLVSVYPSVPEHLLLPPESDNADWLNNKTDLYYRTAGIAEMSTDTKTDFHFSEAVRCAEGMHAGVYVSYAAGIAVKKNDPDLYRELLEKALAINPDDQPESRLANTISQKRAEKMLMEINEIFLLE